MVIAAYAACDGLTTNVPGGFPASLLAANALLIPDSSWFHSHAGLAESCMAAAAG